MFFSILLWQPNAFATTEAELAAISAMAEVNGVALQCRYIEQMQRIKRVLVLHLPKRRELGDWFEQQTNASFMQFMSNDSTCPGSLKFIQQVDMAVDKLQTVFKK